MTDVLTEQAREERIAEAVAAAQAADQQRTEQIQWKDGETLLLPVVRLPLEATVLNPASHRIRSHLEAMGDEAEIVQSDPFGVEAQALIELILRSTPGYNNIRGALESDPQRNPGVVTHKGVLVNANTRRDALDALGRDYIDVVVLPSDATDREITDLELELQMERDVKQEYSFTARLLFIEELIVRRGMSAEEVGLKLERSFPDNPKGRKKARELIEQEMRFLHLIREIVASSAGAIRITKFDDDRQEFIEIDEDFERERRHNESGARRVRDAQLAGLIADLGYMKMRQVDEELIDGYLRDALKEQTTLGPYVADLTSSHGDAKPSGFDSDLGGLDVLEDIDTVERGSGPDTTHLFITLASAPADGDITLRDDDGNEVAVPRQTVVAGIKAAFAIAIDAKRRDTREVGRLEAPMLHLGDATQAIDRARVAVAEVDGQEDFDTAAFDDAAAQLVRAFDEFQQARGEE